MNVLLEAIENNGVVRLAVQGVLSAKDIGPSNENPLAKLIGQRWSSNKILLNLDNASYVDSAAIGWLLTCQRQFKADGGRLVLHSVPPSVRQTFDLLKIGRVITMASDQAQALELVEGEKR